MANGTKGMGQAPPSGLPPRAGGQKPVPPHPPRQLTGLMLSDTWLRRLTVTMRADAQPPASVDWWHGRYDAARPRPIAKTRLAIVLLDAEITFLIV
jgi:hypothetical protein